MRKELRKHFVVTTRWLACLLAMVPLCRSTEACPFCSLQGSTLTLDVADSQIAIVGATQADGSFQIARVLKGEELLQEIASDPTEPLIIENAPANSACLVVGKKLTEGEFDWTNVRPIARPEFDYLVGAIRAAQANPVDLEYFFPFLGHASPQIADDAFYQFARQEYSQLRDARAVLDHDRIIDLIESDDAMPELRAMAFRMLGIVGDERDAHRALNAIEQEDAATNRHITEIMSSYLALAGTDGVGRLREKFLANREAKYVLTDAAINAIRFHLKETDQLDRQELLNSLHAIIDNPEIADVVIPDLIEAEDWTAIEKVANLFRSAPTEKRWLRVAAAKYLIAAPRTETQQMLAELRKIDESAFLQAETGKPPAPVNSRPAENATSRTAFSFLTAILNNALVATAGIATLVAALLLFVLRFLRVKKAG